MKGQSFPSIVDAGCQRVRVAQGEVAAVDRCDCGMYQVHLAAFTLRLCPEALAALSETLTDALAASSAAALARSNTLAGEGAAERWSKS
ncbi:MAG TPA: hypothetical protein VFZ53_26330 [Polyangiaceae bacterium]